MFIKSMYLLSKSFFISESPSLATSKLCNRCTLELYFWLSAKGKKKKSCFMFWSLHVLCCHRLGKKISQYIEYLQVQLEINQLTHSKNHTRSNFKENSMHSSSSSATMGLNDDFLLYRTDATCEKLRPLRVISGITSVFN